MNPTPTPTTIEEAIRAGYKFSRKKVLLVGGAKNLVLPAGVEILVTVNTHHQKLGPDINYRKPSLWHNYVRKIVSDWQLGKVFTGVAALIELLEMPIAELHVTGMDLYGINLAACGDAWVNGIHDARAHAKFLAWQAKNDCRVKYDKYLRNALRGAEWK